MELNLIGMETIHLGLWNLVLILSVVATVSIILSFVMGPVAAFTVWVLIPVMTGIGYAIGVVIAGSSILLYLVAIVFRWLWESKKNKIKLSFKNFLDFMRAEGDFLYLDPSVQYAKYLRKKAKKQAEIDKLVLAEKGEQESVFGETDGLCGIIDVPVLEGGRK